MRYDERLISTKRGFSTRIAMGICISIEEDSDMAAANICSISHNISIWFSFCIGHLWLYYSPLWNGMMNLTTFHYNDVIIGAMASQITSLTIFYQTVYTGADQRTHQSSASLAFVRGIHRWPVNSPQKGPVTRKMLPFDDVIMVWFASIHREQSVNTYPYWSTIGQSTVCIFKTITRHTTKIYLNDCTYDSRFIAFWWR